MLSLKGQLKKWRIFTHDPTGIRTNDPNFQAAEKNSIPAVDRAANIV
jgi:hypothetical protein